MICLLVACVPGPLDETGKQCSSERPCGATFRCVNGRCQDELADAGATSMDAGLPDAGPADAGGDGGPEGDAGLDAGTDAGVDAGLDAGTDGGEYPVDVNLLANPGFELVTSDGGVRNWRATSGVLGAGTPGRTGTWAGRLSTQNATSPVMQSDTVPGRTAFGMLFCAEAWVRHDLDAGPSVTLTIRDRFSDGGIDGSNGGSATIQRGAWRRLREQYVSFGGGSVDVRVSTSRVDPDASVLLDDMLLFRSSGTACVFP